MQTNERRAFRIGDIVEILPQYRDQGDETFTWRVVGAEDKGRVDISPIDCGMQIPPRYFVDVDWIRHVGTVTARDAS